MNYKIMLKKILVGIWPRLAETTLSVVLTCINTIPLLSQTDNNVKLF